MSPIEDKCLYEQLSEDWRHRDRVTWQIPSVLVVISGVLLATTFGVLGGVNLNDDQKFWLLTVGFFFVSLIVILLLRNTYLQGVGAYLMEQFQRDNEDELVNVRLAARRVPWLTSNHGFRLGRFWQTPTSVLLIIFCASLAGLYFYFIAGNRHWWNLNYFWILIGGLIPLTVGLLFVYYFFKKEVIMEADRNGTTAGAMTDGLKEISKKLDKMRQEYLRDKYYNLGYILWGFTLAVVSLAVVNPHPVNILATIVFFIMGWVMWFRARTVKAK